MSTESNRNTLDRFYSAFLKLDYETMQSCYSDNASFSDPVFRNLNAKEVKAMWRMLCEAATDLEIEYQIISVDETEGSLKWHATYSFSSTGRKVVNRISANFEFEDGLIKSHRDHFNLHRWAGMALGTTGWLLGWTPLVRNKIRNKANYQLKNAMKKYVNL